MSATAAASKGPSSSSKPAAAASRQKLTSGAPCTDADYLKMRDSMLHGVPPGMRTNGTANSVAATTPSSSPGPKSQANATATMVAALAALASRNGNGMTTLTVPQAAAAALAAGLGNNGTPLGNQGAAKPTSSAVGSKRAAPASSEANSRPANGVQAGTASKKARRGGQQSSAGPAAVPSPTSSMRGGGSSGGKAGAGMLAMDMDLSLQMGGSGSDGEDWDAAGDGQGGGNEDPDRARLRREKNRVAARKCRAKKVQFMARMQQELKDLTAQNNEMKMQVVTWHRMFSREVKLREAMKRLIQAVWGPTGAAAATGHSANDVLLGLEAGTLDVSTLLASTTSGVAALPPAPSAAGVPVPPAVAPAPPPPAIAPPPPEVAMLDPSLSRLPSLLLEGPLDVPSSYPPPAPPTFAPASATNPAAGQDHLMYGLMAQGNNPPPTYSQAGYTGASAYSNAPPMSKLTAAGPSSSFGGLALAPLNTSLPSTSEQPAPQPPPAPGLGAMFAPTPPPATANSAAAASAAAAAAAVAPEGSQVVTVHHASERGLMHRASVTGPASAQPQPHMGPPSLAATPSKGLVASDSVSFGAPLQSQHSQHGHAHHHPNKARLNRPSFNSCNSSPFAAASSMPAVGNEDEGAAATAGAVLAPAPPSAAVEAREVAVEVSFAAAPASAAAAMAATVPPAPPLAGTAPAPITGGAWGHLSSGSILNMPTAQLGLDLGSAASASMELGTFLTSLTRNSTPPPLAPAAPLNTTTTILTVRPGTNLLRLHELSTDDEAAAQVQVQAAAGGAASSAQRAGGTAGGSSACDHGVQLPAAQLLRTGLSSIGEGHGVPGSAGVVVTDGLVGVPTAKPDPSSTIGSTNSAGSEGTGLARQVSLGLGLSGLGAVLQAADSLSMLRSDTLPTSGLLAHHAPSRLDAVGRELLGGPKSTLSGELMAHLSPPRLGSLPGSLPVAGSMQRNMSLDWLAMALDLGGPAAAGSPGIPAAGGLAGLDTPGPCKSPAPGPSRLNPAVCRPVVASEHNIEQPLGHGTDSGAADAQQMARPVAPSPGPSAASAAQARCGTPTLPPAQGVSA